MVCVVWERLGQQEWKLAHQCGGMNYLLSRLISFIQLKELFDEGQEGWDRLPNTDSGYYSRS